MFILNLQGKNSEQKLQSIDNTFLEMLSWHVKALHKHWDIFEMSTEDILLLEQ